MNHLLYQLIITSEKQADNFVLNIFKNLILA